MPSTESSKESEAPAPAGNSDFRYSTVQRYDENNNLFDAIVIDKYVGSGKDVTVPEKIEDKPVVSVGASAFEGTAVETVEINDNISRIEYSCFKNCSALKSVKLPSKLTTIDFNVFENCTALESIEIPEGVTIPDTIEYKNLTPGETYTIVGNIYDKTTGEVIHTQTFQFVADDRNGQVEIEFTP